MSTLVYGESMGVPETSSQEVRLMLAHPMPLCSDRSIACSDGTPAFGGYLRPRRVPHVGS